MTKILSSVADRFLDLVSPRSEALAACSGSYNICTGSGCASISFASHQYRCTYKANCTDTCVRTGGCCI